MHDDGVCAYRVVWVYYWVAYVGVCVCPSQFRLGACTVCYVGTVSRVDCASCAS